MITERAREAQRLLLGAVFTDPAALARVYEAGLRPEHFADDPDAPGHSRVFRAAVSLMHEGRAVDAFAVASVAKMDVNSVRALAKRPPAHQDPAEYAVGVREEGMWRVRLDAVVRLGEAIAVHDDEAFSGSLASLYRAAETTDVVAPEDLHALVWDEINNPVRGIGLPFSAITGGLGRGLRPGDTTVVSAYSGDGKSLFVGQALEHAFDEQSARCVMMTNETSPQVITKRVIAGRSNVPYSALERGAKDMTEAQRGAVMRAMDDMPFAVAPVFGLPASEVAGMLMRNRWDVAALDLFNRLPGRGTIQQVDEIVTGLCEAAARSGTHLILVAQLNRQGVANAKSGIPPKPTGAELRESGALDTHPANRVMLYRDREKQDGRIVRLPEGVIYVDKARNGSGEGEVKVTLDPRRMRFAMTSAL